MPKYSRFHNRLAEARNRHYGRVCDFTISIYNGDGDLYSISRGKLSDRKFEIDEEKIPIIMEKAVKSLGRWYQTDMNDGEQAVQFQKDVAEGLDRIDKSGLPEKLKLWCLHVRMAM